MIPIQIGHNQKAKSYTSKNSKEESGQRIPLPKVSEKLFCILRVRYRNRFFLKNNSAMRTRRSLIGYSGATLRTVNHCHTPTIRPRHGRSRQRWGAMTKPARGENRPLGHPSRAKCVGTQAAGSCIRPLRYQNRYQTSTLHPRCSAGIVFRKCTILVRFWK